MQQIAVPAETLAQDFIAGVKQSFLDDPPSGPEAFAETYIDPSSAFPDVDSVIAGAKAILINEVSKEPTLRKEIRRTFRTFGVVSVRPTEKGSQVIDELHPYHVRISTLTAPRSHLTHVPLTRLLNTYWTNLLTVC